MTKFDDLSTFSNHEKEWERIFFHFFKGLVLLGVLLTLSKNKITLLCQKMIFSKILKSLFVGLILMTTWVSFASPVLDKKKPTRPDSLQCDPPNWWIGMQQNHLELLVRGTDFTGLQQIVTVGVNVLVCVGVLVGVSVTVGVGVGVLVEVCVIVGVGVGKLTHPLLYFAIISPNPPDTIYNIVPSE